MARTKYNHQAIIKSFQPSPSKAIYPGMIVDFKYIGKNIFDKKPFVLVLWNEYGKDMIHGINLNYLSKQKIETLFSKLIKGAKTYSKQKNIFMVEDQDDENDYDDNLPYRNLLKKPYTRLKLPTYKETRGRNPLSKSEAKTQMNMLYEKVIKGFMRKGKSYEVYRSYKFRSIKNLRVLNIDLDKI
tara:strand:+ start:74 stop:628 length:555 start_codon:yes stop_codon:yes gene_type:complete